MTNDPSHMTDLLLILLILSPLTALVYAWLLYPVLLAAAASRTTVGRAAGRGESRGSPGPSMSVAILLSAHNEEEHIAKRIANLLALDPTGTEPVIRVGVDGSDDRTAARAVEQAAGRPDVLVRDVRRRRGKIAMLKDLVAESREDILVFTDANTEFEPHTVNRLLSHFSDPRIGGVCGRLIFIAPPTDPRTDPDTPHQSSARAEHGAGQAPTPYHSHTSSTEGFYWRWETRLKGRESAIDSCLGANGAVYAVRRHLFWTGIPSNTVIDDFVIGMKVREQGFRMVYDPEAVAREELPAAAVAEWRRRVRIGAGDYQALGLCRRCLLPRYGRFAWAFWSHKVLRWFTPHLMVLLAAAAVAAAVSGTGGVRALGAACTGFLAAVALCGIAGRFVSGSGSLPARVLQRSTHFLAMQAALFAGFLRFCRGGLEGHWARTPRG